jgi:hypothetical protein
MGKKVPVAATTGAVVSLADIYAGYGQSGLRGAMYHATGYDYSAKTFHWQAGFNTWKPALFGALISYGASKVGAARITNKIPIVGKFFKV